ncbi:hypothetical protein Pla123a_17140 [Posidoniimonas polymericola]|uniref:Uncharacterized protein n=1 Tax=Posidoniimonas polymericola TaxID=2528002 RepID=A0A5C5YSJ2_9BACT|nr:hypothetical protein [Posidoniimonas polymericola]TWT77915.1 hypothetical protein Pla123a_17140 [Posidoniimonas polymericola]
MAENKQPLAPLFSQVDVSTGSPTQASLPPGEEQNELLREVLSAQDRTNELLEELVGAMAAQHKQRSNELNQWKSANPRLAKRCRKAAEALSQVQVEYLDRMTEEIMDNREDLVYGEFMLSEFIDRFGPRLAHLNGVIQVLAQLSANSSSDEADA